MARLTGEFEKLDRQIRKLKGADKALDIVARQCGETTLDLIRDGFRNERDPYGDKWKAPLLRKGRALSDRGRLRSSWHIAKANRSELRVATAVSYAGYHQSGTGVFGPRKKPIVPVNKRALSWKVGRQRYFASSVQGAPKRLMVPTKSRGLPKRWRTELIATAQEVLETELGPG
ncbi:MAG: phage virion morphogenesis protein [Pseudomonadota bacterium]